MQKIYLLSNQKFDQIENLEVFGIEYLCLDIDLSKYDALLFTSKNAVLSLNHSNQHWKNIPSYAISSKTAQVVKNLGGKLVFTGIKSSGDDFAYELIEKLQDKKVLYIKAFKTVSNLTNILKKNGVFIDELIAYKNICKKIHKDVEKNSIFIFTSPSSIECFFKNFTWDSSFKAIVIGNTSAKYMPKNIDFIVSSKTSFEECINIALNMRV